MKISLASLGWISEKPKGNRLRWFLDCSETVNDKYIGLPTSIIVERAPLEEYILEDNFESNITSPLAAPSREEYECNVRVPLNWWEDLGTQELTSRSLEILYTLTEPVQAIRFIYRGRNVRLLAYYQELVVADRILSDGDSVCLQAAFLDKLTFLSSYVRLENIQILNLYRERGFKFEPIAEIKVEETINSDYNSAYQRYSGSGTLENDNWNDLQILVHTAIDQLPSNIEEDKPAAWREFQAILGLRWEFAVLYGFGFVDGPSTQPNSIDEIYENRLLKNIPSHPVIYRVRCLYPDQPEQTSNISICWHHPIVPLSEPNLPIYDMAEVKLDKDEEYHTETKIVWRQNDMHAIGFEFEEIIGKSKILGTSEIKEGFEYKSRKPEDRRLSGTFLRRITVPFYDVALQLRCRSIDGWDRVSNFTSWTPPMNLNLIHNPIPPSLSVAYYDDQKNAIIALKTNASGTIDWSPDHVVKHTPDSRIIIYRRIQSPSIRDITVNRPTLVNHDFYYVNIPGVPNPEFFLGGFLIAGGTKFMVENISSDRYYFHSPVNSENTLLIFDSGVAKLQQLHTHPSLWTEVSEFPVVGLPKDLVFRDEVMPPLEEARSEYYCARVKFGTIVGLASNVVSLLLLPSAPSIPPMFTSEFLGIDFYNRTLVKIQFNSLINSLLSVWWADGEHDITSFERHAIPGEYGSQRPDNNRCIYDVLSIPIPSNVDHTITLGVQTVTIGGGQSKFRILTRVLRGLI